MGPAAQWRAARRSADDHDRGQIVPGSGIRDPGSGVRDPGSGIRGAGSALSIRVSWVETAPTSWLKRILPQSFERLSGFSDSGSRILDPKGATRKGARRDEGFCSTLGVGRADTGARVCRPSHARDCRGPRAPRRESGDSTAPRGMPGRTTYVGEMQRSLTMRASAAPRATGLPAEAPGPPSPRATADNLR